MGVITLNEKELKRVEVQCVDGHITTGSKTSPLACDPIAK